MRESEREREIDRERKIEREKVKLLNFLYVIIEIDEGIFAKKTV